MFADAIVYIVDDDFAVRERMVAGDSNKVIAKRLGVSVRTVEVRRSNVFRKMHANSLAELVRMQLEARPPTGTS